jgi:DNA-binding NarL/FixJ family response regulator
VRKRLPPPGITVHKDEGRRIAQQLQEGVCQMLFAAKTKIALLRSPGDDAHRNGLLDELQTIVDETMEQGRSLARELDAWSPPELGQLRSSGGLTASRKLAGHRPADLRERHEVGSPLAVSHPRPVVDRSHSLSDREREVLQLLARGLGTRQISQTLHVGTGTIGGYRRSIIQKLGLRGVARLTKYAVATGLTSLNE